MTDLPAHQILYDLQYARGGDGDERKYVNVTDIAGPHADALLAQIERDQIERERLRLQQHSTLPTTTTTTTTNGMPSSARPLGFDRQHAEVLQEQKMVRFGYLNGEQPSTSYDADELQRKSELILQRRRQQQEQEEREAERLAFGSIDTDRSQRRVTYEPNMKTDDLDDLVCS